MDPITIGLLAGAGLGVLKGNKNVKKEVENDRYRKVAVAMSPWTGQGDPGALNLAGPLESAASGAAMGGQVGGMMGKMGAPAAGVQPQAQMTSDQTYQQMQQNMGPQQGVGPYSQLYAGSYGSPGAMGAPMQMQPMMPYSQLGKLQYG